MTPSFRSGIGALALATLLVVVGAGCAKKGEEANAVRPAETAAPEQKAKIPGELMTQGARMFGAPFDRDLHMKLTISDDKGKREYFVYRSYQVSLSKDAVVVNTRLVNAPEGLDAGETYELRKDGVWAIAVGQSKFDPPFRALPAEVSELSVKSSDLKRWSYETTAMNTKVNATVIAVRKEKVSVPLGEFDAWRIETKMTIGGGAAAGTLTDVSFYVEEVGVVKSEVSSSTTAMASAGAKSTTTRRILLEAIPEP